MTDALTKVTLCELAGETVGPCVSIYMPTHSASEPDGHDAGRLRRLVRDARARLSESGAERLPALRSQFEYLDTLVRDRKFWLQQSIGLAVFIGPNRCNWFRVPLCLHESASIGSTFCLKRLLPLLSESARFFVLSLTQGGVRLFECTHEVTAEFPITAAEPPCHESAQYAPFIRCIALRLRILALRCPVVLAGQNSLIRSFRRAADDVNLLDDCIITGPEGLPTRELHRRGIELLQTRADRILSSESNLFFAQKDCGGASCTLHEILPAAYLGRVECLFLRYGARIWGKYDVCDWAVCEHPAPLPGDQDLADLAAIMTYVHDGSVFVLNPDAMPTDQPVAAVFR